MQWHLSNDRRLHWRSWGGETVVYDDVSGETHYLEPLAAEIFEILQISSADTNELTKSVSASLGLERDDELMRAVSAVVVRLSRAGLIELVPS